MWIFINFDTFCAPRVKTLPGSLLFTYVTSIIIATYYNVLYPYSTQATNRLNRHELIFFLFGGIREVLLFIFLQSWWATSRSRFRYDVITNIRGNRLNSAGIAQEFITIRK